MHSRRGTVRETSQSGKNTCLSCGSSAVEAFYEARQLPVHSVLLLPSRELAVNYPKRDLALAFCRDCGFIFNALFESSVHEYSSRYEETQSFSSTFNAFHQRLAERLIDAYNLRGKQIIEIGCGKGEFLSLLCELGGNSGIGFDPSYVEGRGGGRAGDRIRVIKDFYSDAYRDLPADFVCCKMTLEHIQNTAGFVGTVRSSVGDNSGTIVFFQVPDVTRILREVAFWDIYYEHCSYFAPASLSRLFRRCGFEVLRLEREYGGQYLTIEAKAADGRAGAPLTSEEDLSDLARDVADFSVHCGGEIQAWRRRIQSIGEPQHRTVLWGGGSKAVAFLTTLGIGTEIRYVVDINPYRQGTYLAGSGQEIVAPVFLRGYKPDVVIVMNPIYREEIERELHRMRLAPALLNV